LRRSLKQRRHQQPKNAKPASTGKNSRPRHKPIIGTGLQEPGASTGANPRRSTMNQETLCVAVGMIDPVGA
jgi:hypothetical protein